ncbi:MAG: hypothetical protein KIT60_16950 [Burkholderiaceae bacterium]|nr:hypothetical protein [Burkholderiaceae bacterium]
MIRTAELNKTLRSRHHWLAKLLAALLLLVVAAGAARAGDDDPPGRVGRVIESQGQSWLYDTDSDEWIELQRNRPITTGNRIAVDASARLELRVGSTTLRLAGGSELEVRRLDDERIDFFLVQGSAALRVRSQDVSREIEIATPEGRFTPRRAGHYRIDHRDTTSVATVWNGDLHFENDSNALDVGSGRSAEFWREADATHYSWVEAQTDEFADWVARANREDDRTGAVTRYVSPEMTGYEDLDRNGRWESHPEYGALWMPTTVVTGWAPYRYGHWTWISPWGWTWVDDAPWGFAPFHYGRWVVVGGRWCWAPGRYVARPVYAPALVAWVGKPRVHPGPPLVGWVPLAPREAYYPHYARSTGYWKSVNYAQLHLLPHNTPRRTPTQPIRYANQGAPGGVSAVPSTELRSRRPIAPVVAQIDSQIGNNLASQPLRPHVPPPGVARTIGVPGAGHGATRPAVPPGVRPAPGIAPQPPAAVARERQRIPRPVAPPATVQTAPRQVSPAVRSEAVPQLQTPARPPAASPAPGAQPRRIEPPGDPQGRRPPMASPGVNRAPPEVHRTPAPLRPEMREPPRVPQAPPAAPAPRAVMPTPPTPAPRVMTPAPSPRAAMPAQPPMQREMQRGREPEARVRAPQQPRGQPGREQSR